MVPMAGLEPAQLAPHAPQACVSTNFTTSACITIKPTVTNIVSVTTHLSVLTLPLLLALVLLLQLELVLLLQLELALLLQPALNHL